MIPFSFYHLTKWKHFFGYSRQGRAMGLCQWMTFGLDVPVLPEILSPDVPSAPRLKYPSISRMISPHPVGLTGELIL